MNYEVIFSSRRTISLSIKNEKLIVRAPYGISKMKIEELVKNMKNGSQSTLKFKRKEIKKYRILPPKK